jgi:cell wall-associated NlpC family hydrolase
MNNKFATIATLALLLTSCVTSASAQAETPQITSQSTFMSHDGARLSPFMNKVITDKQLNARTMTLSKNTKELHSAVYLTSQSVNKTWYVFSGSTPQGWDCSGLVKWTYAHLGFDLYHSATAQMNSGYSVRQPKYGDIVGFRYHGASSYYHVGIYISEDRMLHSGGKKGDKTEFRSISDFAGSYSAISYTRMVETN